MMKKKLQIFKTTISNLNNQGLNNVLGGAGTRYCSDLCSENPGCDTQNDCGITWGQPYACATVNAKSCPDGPGCMPIQSDTCPRHTPDCPPF